MVMIELPQGLQVIKAKVSQGNNPNLYLRPLLPLLFTNQGQKLSIPFGHGTKGRCGQKCKSRRGYFLVKRPFFIVSFNSALLRLTPI